MPLESDVIGVRISVTNKEGTQFLGFDADVVKGHDKM